MGRGRDVFVVDYQFYNYRKGPKQFADYLRKNGVTVEIYRAVCVADAVVQICRDLEDHQDRTNSIRVLRFYGHGGEGVQIVGGDRSSSDNEQVIGLSKLGKVRHANSLAHVGALLDKQQGRVELHGCSVGKVSGKKLLQQLADRVFRVPVIAGTKPQYSRTKNEAMTFEGQARMAIPGGKSTRVVNIESYSLE